MVAELTPGKALRLSIYGGLIFLFGFILLDRYVYYLTNGGLNYWGLLLAGLLTMAIFLGIILFYPLAIVHLMMVRKYRIGGTIVIILAALTILIPLYHALSNFSFNAIVNVSTNNISFSTLLVIAVYYFLYRSSYYESSRFISSALLISIIAWVISIPLPTLSLILNIVALAILYKGLDDMGKLY